MAVVFCCLFIVMLVGLFDGWLFGVFCLSVLGRLFVSCYLLVLVRDYFTICFCFMAWTLLVLCFTAVDVII